MSHLSCALRRGPCGCVRAARPAGAAAAMATPGSAGVLPARVRMMESLKCDQLRAVLGALRVSKQGNKGALQERAVTAEPAVAA